MRHSARHLHGEAKVTWRQRCPLLVNLHRVWAMEGGIDLGAVQHAGIPLEVRARPRESLGREARDAPACGAYANHSSASLFNSQHQLQCMCSPVWFGSVMSGARRLGRTRGKTALRRWLTVRL